MTVIVSKDQDDLKQMILAIIQSEGIAHAHKILQHLCTAPQCDTTITDADVLEALLMLEQGGTVEPLTMDRSSRTTLTYWKLKGVKREDIIDKINRKQPDRNKSGEAAGDT